MFEAVYDFANGLVDPLLDRSDTTITLLQFNRTKTMPGYAYHRLIYWHHARLIFYLWSANKPCLDEVCTWDY